MIGEVPGILNLILILSTGTARHCAFVPSSSEARSVQPPMSGQGRPHNPMHGRQVLPHKLDLESEISDFDFDFFNPMVRDQAVAHKFLLYIFSLYQMQLWEHASGAENVESRFCEVESSIYEEYKHILKPNLAKRAEHYFSESKRVTEGIVAWGAGNLVEFGKLISASGLSSIQNYECGFEPMIQLYEILLRAPGVFGARFSGAGFRGCCLAFVDANQANEAASFVQNEYSKAQPELSSQVPGGRVVLICDGGDFARVV